MSKRKERQAQARQDYATKRAPAARWLAGHKARCKTCGAGTECNMVTSARFRGLSFP